jgi:excinuclease UvrABC ATPase subunit
MWRKKIQGRSPGGAVQNKSIFDVLELSVDESIEFFKEEKALAKALQPLQDVGLGYVKLGQSSDTLSGGEAQRVKLASFLARAKQVVMYCLFSMSLQRVFTFMT